MSFNIQDYAQLGITVLEFTKMAFNLNDNEGVGKGTAALGDVLTDIRDSTPMDEELAARIRELGERIEASRDENGNVSREVGDEIKDKIDDTLTKWRAYRNSIGK